MSKGSIQEEDIIIVNIYARSIRTPQYKRKALTNIKTKKLTRKHVLNYTLDEMDLIDIFRTFHPNAEECTFFSSAHGTFSRIDHILGHKSSLSKFKKIEIISSIFSDHNAMRLEINYKKNTVNNTNMCC